MISTLTIRQLELLVFLGWPDEERMRKQVVLIDIDIRLPTPPKACETDHLEDTVCYSTLINQLRQQLAEKKFHLVEYLAREIYDISKPSLPVNTRIMIHLTKHPMITGLTGGVCFSYGDDN